MKILCVFHKEKTPSLHVRKNGTFRCYGCGAKGHVDDYPQVLQASERKKVERLEAAGQLRFPGF